MASPEIDLSTIPAPTVVEPLSFEAILAEMLADLRARDPKFSATVESDPAYKILEVAAYRELLIRQRVNDGARAVMLAYANGSDLDNLAALYGVVRQVLDPGTPDTNPPVPPTLETDAELRRRTQLALEGFSTAGPVEGYRYHALSVVGVKDASVDSPQPGDVVVTVLGHAGDGDPAQGVVDAVEAILSADDIRPLTDSVTVQGATIIPYTIEADIYTLAGPDPDVVMAAAAKAVHAYVVAQHRLGRDITLSGVFAALHQPGVQRVDLDEPSASIPVDPDEAAYCAVPVAIVDSAGDILEEYIDEGVIEFGSVKLTWKGVDA